VDVKNTYRACSDNRKVSGFLLGLVVALSLFLVALEFTSQSGMPEVGDDVLDDVSQDIEMMPAVHRDDMVAAAPGGSRSSVSDKINVVDKPVDDDAANAPMTDKEALKKLLGVGFGGNAAVSDVTLQPAAVNADEDNPLNFQVVERLPEFPGGMSAFVQWLTKNLKYPLTAQRAKRQGTVLVSFIVNKDGSIADRKVVKSVSPELDREALRVLRLMPKWKPGEDHGKPCRTYFCIPIVFKL
jgi:protein TonB